MSMSFHDHTYATIPSAGGSTAKRRRRRNDDDNDDDDHNYARPSPNPTQTYIRALDSDTQFNRKFKLQSVKTSFMIENLPSNPEAMLRSLFVHCVLSALREAEHNGITPDQLGAVISSELLDPNIWIPIRRLTQNTADSILNRFLEVAQSKSREGSIWGAPFTVAITTLDVVHLPRQREIRGRGKTLKSVRHVVKESALLRVCNDYNSYCLFYALELSRIYHTGEMRQQNFSYYINHLHERQRQDVVQLMEGAEIPMDLPEYDAIVFVPQIVDFWNEIYAISGQKFKVFIFGSVGQYKPKFQYGPDNFNVALSLYHADGHFDGIRCGVGRAIFGRDYYCFSCECPYNNSKEHTARCTARCINCCRVGVGHPCKPDNNNNNNNNYSRKCDLCGKTFVNVNCFHHHLVGNVCHQYKKCEKCGVIWKVKNNTQRGRQGHVCGEKFCHTCKSYHDTKRGCFIQKLKPRQPKKYRLIAFDCETTQNTRVAGAPDRRLHSANFISAHVVCTKCIRDNIWRNSLRHHPPCQVCGQFRTVTFSQCPYERTETDAQHVAQDPIEDFVRWLLTGFDRRHPTVLFAHFGGRFDNIMLFRQLFLRGICPQMIRRGNKLYEMKISKGPQNPEIIIRDSWNLMPVALGLLPGAFGLNVRDKEFFPHLANVETNYGRVLPQLPPKSDYLYGGMIPDRQRRFDEWYAEHQHEEFDLCEQLAAYCTNDTRILIEALIAFRTEFLQVSDPLERHTINDEEEEEEEEEDVENGAAFEVADGGIDIAWEPMTIASASMKHFRLNHLKRDQLAIVPERGYDTANTQSLLALKFLNWYAEAHGVRIQTAHSPGGEKKIGPSYTVDGYISDTDTVIEVNGCHWHAHDHPRHRFFPQTVMASGKTAAKIREADARRLAFIRTQVREVLVFWECEIGDAKRQDAGMQQSFAAYRDKGPISLKDAYHGGRVGPQRLHYQVSSGWTMKYYDVRSLYPFTNAVTAYPTGHPVRVNVINDADSAVDWRHPDDIPVRGILKVFVVPPLHIDVPVLPVKFDQRLLFPLCRRCAIQYPEGGVRVDYRCSHTSDEERGWVSTVTSIELAEALRNGYRCTAYYRSIEWEEVQWDDRVFRGYVAEFMAMKTHASGFPDDVQTEEQQQQFMDECEEMFGIRIDPDKMEHNKAKRTIAKLCNNSLWGRFSLRNGLSKTVVTDSPAELRALLDNSAIEVSAIDQLNDECLLITYTSINEWIEEHGCSNIMLSLWTTSAARLHLLRLMQAVVRAPNAVLIYTDTDSVCFAYREADGCPLTTGPHLGDLSDEWPEHELLEFVSGGCKQYALRMRHCQTGEEKTVLKVRGITLCADACRLLHFETFKRSVLRYADAEDDVDGDDDDDEDDTISIEYPNFLRPSLRDGTVMSVKLTKRYRPIVTKGIVGRDVIVHDFGYTP